MGKRGRADSGGADAAQLGLWSLMLKLPALRGRLQIAASRSSALNDLLEAYEEASFALERFMKRGDPQSRTLADEYTALCAEIESDIIRHLLDTTSPLTD